MHEVAVELRGIAVLEAAELPGEHGVERVGEHGERDIEVDLGEDRRRHGVEVEELHRLSDAVLDAPAASVIADEGLDVGVEVIADEEGGLLAAVATHDDLTDIALVV